ncbi:hypothetical protein [Pseudomonas sp. 382]|uniref:hypothetical protein n=1 Tax=Pseudomonas sp. 382 TaxID=1751969 RepID=UPI000C17DBD6|nr:hypothetical protein [Pseudomonas sp. 382]PIK75557.1 hypothetical protein CQW31_26770 [Pseudomonas sp. 382]
MQRKFEVKRVPKVVVKGFRPGEVIQPSPANQFWFVIEDEGGGRHGEFDLEADAISERDRLSDAYR